MLHASVIESIRHKGLKRFFQDGDASKLDANHVEKIREILTALDAAESEQDMDLPTLGFHALAGDMKGRFAVKVQGPWRITFEFEGGNAKRVDFENYHKGKH